jgi:outer membrane autotransporter protein
VRPTIISLGSLGGSIEWTILSATGGATNNGITVLDTPTVDFELVFPANGTDLVLTIADVNFMLSGQNQNQQAIAGNLNKFVAAGVPPSMQALFDALANLPTEAAVAAALDQLSPETYLDAEIATLLSSLAFTNSLMTCPTRDGAAAFIKEGECVWARVSGREFEQDKTVQTLGFEETSFEVAGGLQGKLGEVWRVGGALGYEHGSLDTASFTSSDVDRLHGGAVLKYNPGPLLLAAAVSGGMGWYDTERTINFPGFFAQAQADNEISYVDGRFRAEYLLSNGRWYAKPMVDLDATHINLDGTHESFASGAGLNVRGSDETVFSATPMLEFGTEFGVAGGTLVRPYIRGGATLFDDPDFVLLASFEGAPSGVGPFRIAAATDDVVGNVGVGVDVIGADGASFRLYYDGRFGDTVEEHAGGIKATLPF